MSEAIISARNINVSFGSNQILRDIHIDIYPGEVLALVGPNGAGKSTLMGVITGDVPHEGSLTWRGKPLSAHHPKELAQDRAVMLQENNVAFGFTVAEIIRMGRAPWEGTPEESRDDAIVIAAHQTAGVTHLAARKFPSLSGGEKARAAFGRVLAQDSQVLLLDEPTAALDIHYQEEILSEARQQARQGATVIMVVHDLTLAAAYADRIVVLGEGTICGDGTPSEVLTSDRLSEVYHHPIETLIHPENGSLIILPRRSAPAAASASLSHAQRSLS